MRTGFVKGVRYALKKENPSERMLGGVFITKLLGVGNGCYICYILCVQFRGCMSHTSTSLAGMM